MAGLGYFCGGEGEGEGFVLLYGLGGVGRDVDVEEESLAFAAGVLETFDEGFEIIKLVWIFFR